MELPRKILVGDNLISEIGNFIKDINNGISSVVVISGESVKNKFENKIRGSLKSSGIENYWFIRKEASFDAVSKIIADIKKLNLDLILGIL